jgi:hypothetical protein
MNRQYRLERQFGSMVGGILIVLGTVGVWRSTWPMAGRGAIVVGLVLLLLGLVSPRALVWPCRAWMALAEVLSFVTSRVILGLVFALAVTPIGLLQRLRGYDPLGRRKARGRSYWVEYSPRLRNSSHFDKPY